MREKIIGVDIGGTTITAALIKNGSVGNFVSLPTQAEKTAEEILENLFQAIQHVMSDGTSAIGIGVPGLVDSEEGRILQITNIPAWNGLNLRKSVENKFGLPAFLENDANCFVLGVKHFGAGKEFENIVSITLGTGLGAGLLIHNKIYKGLHNGAGELSFIPYKDSNLEKYCSGNFFSEYKKERGEVLFQKAENSDEYAIQCWQEYGTHVAQLVRIVLLSYAPQMIAFGGSATKGFKYFSPAMEKNLETFELQSLLREVKIIQVGETNNAVLGAAALAL